MNLIKHRLIKMTDNIEGGIIGAISEIRELQDNNERTVLNGNCSSFEHYKELSGRTRAYGDCQKILTDLLDRIQRGDI